MKIFCDTNIIAEFLEKRLQFEAVAKIIKLSSDKHTLFLSEGGFYTITFLVDKQLRRMNIYNPERLVNERKILLRILDTFQIVTAVLLTINIKDFDGVKDKQQIKIMTPQTFVEQYQKSW